MTNGVYLHLKFKSTLPTSTVEFIQACINSPKDGLMYISNYRDIPETWLTLWGTHPEWPQWYARTLAFNKDGTSTLQLASASNLSTVPILKSFIESVLPYTDSTGLIGLFITKPWIEYPKLLTVHKGKTTL